LRLSFTPSPRPLFIASLVKPTSAYPLSAREPAERATLQQFAKHNLNLLLIANPAAAALLVACLNDKAPEAILMPWFAVFLGLTMMRLSVAKLLLKNLDDTDKRERLMQIPPALAFLEGLCWGVTPFLFNLPANDPVRTAQIALVFGVSALAVHTLCLQRAAMACFMVAALAPMALWNLLPWAGGGANLPLGFSALAVLGLCLAYGHAAGKLGREGIYASSLNSLLSTRLKHKEGELRIVQRKKDQVATRDPLTQCYNRRAMLEYLGREMSRQDRQGPTLGVLLIDVDYLSRFNDQYGYLTGDAMLRALTLRVHSQLRGSDFLARYGAEEFICIVQADDEGELMLAAERVRSAVEQRPMLERPAPITITVSVGATLRRTNESPQQLFNRANDALLAAKGAGRNRVELRSLEAHSGPSLDIELSQFPPEHAETEIGSRL
jgi:diguanylate cyclase (GGDEF)-like protein